MKNLILSILFLNSFGIFSQKLFTEEEFLIASDNGRRWYTDIKIYLYGNFTKKDSLDVVENIKTFKSLIKPINISLVNNKESSNVVIYFLSDSDFGNIFADERKKIKDCIGITSTYGVYKITESVIQIDVINNKRLNSFSNTIRHEMFHMLGFAHYREEKNSILDMDDFLTEKDIEMIKYLYSKKFNT
jgi:hypothetical protein